MYIIPDENKAYFDINSAILKCPAQDLVVNSPGINQIAVKQFSVTPDIVRVLIRYNEGYNPKNIQLRKLNNTLFVWFRQPQVQNYYFQQVYGDILSEISRFYESISIQIPVIANQNNIMNQINSAFNITTNSEPEYVLTKKILYCQQNIILIMLMSKTGLFMLPEAALLLSQSRSLYLILQELFMIFQTL